MFLYTFFEILLYVVSIFNTSANVKSFDFLSRFRTLRLILFIIIFIWILIFSTAKVSFFTGTYICRTTDILMKNYSHAVHGSYLLLSVIFNLIEQLILCSFR